MEKSDAGVSLEKAWPVTWKECYRSILGISLVGDRKDEVRYGYLTVLLLNISIWPGHFSMSITVFFNVLAFSVEKFVVYVFNLMWKNSLL